MSTNFVVIEMVFVRSHVRYVHLDSFLDLKGQRELLFSGFFLSSLNDQWDGSRDTPASGDGEVAFFILVGTHHTLIIEPFRHH